MAAAALALCLLVAAPPALAQDGSFGGRDDSPPVPDPTVLTTQQLDREITSLREILEARLNGMDEALRLFRSNIERVPTETDRAVARLREQLDERFAAIEQRFGDRDILNQSQERARNQAVAAAFDAAAELAAQQNASNVLAVTKSEESLKEQLEQVRELLRTDNSSLRNQVDDLKERLTSIEQRTVGQIQAQAQIEGSQVQWVGVLGLIFGTLAGVGGLIIGIIGFVTRYRERPAAVTV